MNPPSMLQATAASSTQINISWTDNSDNESGFRIECANDSGGSPGTWVEIYSTLANAVSYNNSVLSASIKSVITVQESNLNPVHVLGFGWRWDMTWINNPGGTEDPAYGVHWAGASAGGPQGNLIWGLDAADQTLTGNTVCMDTYLNAVIEYIGYCHTNNYKCKVIFTTGPVDGNAGSEKGFQRELKHEHIRNFVKADSSRILFDYADILCWNNDGVQNITTWDDSGTPRTHPNIHADNMLDYDTSWNTVAHTEDGDHIGEVGALRIEKVIWWLLARIAGWDGVSSD